MPLGGLLGGIGMKFGRKAVAWGIKRIGRGNARRIGEFGRKVGRVAGSPGGQVVISGGGAVAGGHIARRRRQAASDPITAAYHELLGRDPTAEELRGWKAELESGRVSVAQMRAFIAKHAESIGHVPEEGGAFMDGAGDLTGLLLAEPEAYEALRCPQGYVLVDLGQGPMCMNREVAYALGIRKRPRKGGLTGSEIRAAKKVQRFGQGLFVNKVPKVRLKKGRR